MHPPSGPETPTKDCVRPAGRRAALREGAAGALQRAQRARVPLHVLSVSWSGELVRGALQGAVAVAHGCARTRMHARPRLARSHGAAGIWRVAVWSIAAALGCTRGRPRQAGRDGCGGGGGALQ